MTGFSVETGNVLVQVVLFTHKKTFRQLDVLGSCFII
jgi:hypothetical protein